MSDSLRPPEGFAKLLNRHGYGLQYSVLKAAEDLNKRHRSSWVFEAAEFPVQVKGTGTRIDFILRHSRRSQLLVAECKRANPAVANWCFVSAPYVRDGRATEEVFAEHLYVAGNLNLQSAVKSLGYTSEAYHLGFEMTSKVHREHHSDDRGKPDSKACADSDSKGRGAIEEAATQVCRGLNGLVEFYSRGLRQLDRPWELTISPVIFTTANLWASDIDLSRADLRTGEVNREEAKLMPRPYVIYQYHLSPGIKHQLPQAPGPTSLAEVLDAEHVRTIHIVNANFVDQFLSFASEIWPS
jgi:hypothetical protein